SGAPFPARPQILFITFAVILVTLVVQGPTLAPMARLLRLRQDGRALDEEAHARFVSAESGLRARFSRDDRDDSPARSSAVPAAAPETARAGLGEPRGPSRTAPR